MAGYIDLHLHILPGLDDGPGDISGAVKLARALVEQGFNTAVATPHCIEGRPAKEEILAVLQQLNEVLIREGIPLNLLPGAELVLEPELTARLKRGEVLTLNNGPYVMIELPMLQPLPPYAPDLLFELRGLGYYPLLAHPERITDLQNNSGRLVKLIRSGAYTQVTISSLDGGMGRQAKHMAEKLLRLEAVHFLATDAHKPDGRVKSVNRTLRDLVKHLGRQAAAEILYERPRKLLRGEPVRVSELAIVKKRSKRGLFSWKQPII